MPRASKSGVRGLFRDNTGQLWIDLRWRDPSDGSRKRYRERLPRSITMAAAKRRAGEILSSALAGTFDPKRVPPKRLRTAFDAYLTWLETERPKSVANRKIHATALVGSLHDVELDTIGPLAVERFKRERRSEGREPGTINRHLTTLKHFARKADEWGWMRADVATAIRGVRLMREPPGRVRYLSPDEETALLAALPSSIRDLALAAALSGMRRSELVALRWSQVDLATRWIVLTRTKSNRVRRVPINDALAHVLGAIDHPTRGDGWVFRMPIRTEGAEGVSRDEESRRRDYVSRVFRDAVRAAGIDDLRFHDLRHDFATRVRRAGGGIDAIATLLGHSTLAMATRYTHIEDPLLRAAVRPVQAFGSARDNVVDLAKRRDG